MGDTPLQSGTTFKISDLLDLGTRHFALLSAGVILLGGFSATLFLASYLRVFDWRLIWIIEPSDILKVGIFSLAFLSGFLALIQIPINFAQLWEEASPIYKRATIAFFCLAFAGNILQDELSSQQHFEFHFYIFFLLALLFSFLVFLPKIKGRIRWGIYFALFAITGFTACIVAVGNLVGIYVKEIGGFSESVWTKDEQFQNVVVILATSHHTALLTKSDGVIVIPSTDIKKMQSIPAK